MKDLVVFIKDVKLDGVVIFENGKEYEILDENSLNYYVQMKKNTNEVCMIPKTESSVLFTLKERE